MVTGMSDFRFSPARQCYFYPTFKTVNSRIKDAREECLRHLVRHALCDAAGQDVAEYAIMIAVILVIMMGMVHLIGANASNIFSQAGSSIQ